MEVFVVNKTIKLHDDEEFITLGTLLKMVGIIYTGGMAKIYLSENVVYVDNEPENRRGRKLYRGMQIRISDKIYVIE